MNYRIELNHSDIPVFRRMNPIRWVVQSGYHVLSTVLGTFPSYYKAMLYQRKMQGKPPPIKVDDFTVQDYGMESESYFQGGSSLESERFVVGIGDNPIEALDDALELIALGDDDIDFDNLESRIKGAYPAFTRKPEDLPSANQYVMDQWKEDNPYKDLDEAEEDIQNHECHYYIGVGWNLPSTAKEDKEDTGK